MGNPEIPCLEGAGGVYSPMSRGVPRAGGALYSEVQYIMVNGHMRRQLLWTDRHI